MNKKLDWGIIATGGIARKFATALPESYTGRLVAIGSRTTATAEKFAKDFPGVRAHGSYEALLADPEVSAVYVATPHPSHLEWTIRAAEAGKHILCEKPIAMNRADAVRMINAVREHRVFLMEAFMYRCHPQTERLAELVAGGAIGKLQAIHSTFTVNIKFDPAHRLFDKVLGGGTILDLGCYPVSFARRMAGAALGRTFAEPVRVMGAGRLNAVTGADEYASATLAFQGGVTAQVSCGFFLPLAIAAQLFGTAGRIDVPNPFHPGNRYMPAGIVMHKAGIAVPETITVSERRPPHAIEADAVADALARGELESQAMNHEDTLGNMAALDAWRTEVGIRYAEEG